MRLELAPKSVDSLVPTPLVHQTAFWGRVQRRLGFGIDAFDLAFYSTSAPAEHGDLLVVRVAASDDVECAYVPMGPELAPDAGEVGLFLERASQQLRPLLGPRCAFIRWDLPWTSIYAREPGDFTTDGQWRGPPTRRARELRLNFGTDERNLHKAPRDLLPADTVLVDLTPSDDVLLARMHAKTRYNLRLARRRGVVVEERGMAGLPTWYGLYLETAARNRFEPMPFSYFEALLAEKARGSTSPVMTRLLVARHGRDALAGLLVAIAPSRATYLYGASTRARSELMAPYALQWAAMQLARTSGCRDYDMFGASPRSETPHPLAGVHRFKIGFGGELVHREGCWDFPYDDQTYAILRRQEEAHLVRRSIAPGA